MRLPARLRSLLVVTVLLSALLAGGAVRRTQDTCGPFTDVSPLFCPYVLEAYYTGITAGTSSTTFSPDIPMTRGQAAVFVTKGLNQALARGSRRAALGQWWTTDSPNIGVTPIGNYPAQCRADGADIWAANLDGTVSRVRGSDGKLLETWTGAQGAFGVLVAMGRVFITGNNSSPGRAYMLDPTQPPGEVTTIADNLGDNTVAIAFDGARLWTVGTHTVSIITPGPGLPWATTNVTEGFSTPADILYDGAQMWVADDSKGLLRLDANGAILQTVAVGYGPHNMTFDGTNIWVPNTGDNSISVVRASTGDVIATLTGNGLSVPVSAAFDGRRALITNITGLSVSLWDAASLTAVGSIDLGASPNAACSDGLNSWITLQGTPGQLARF